jgi:hypothetical protein
MHQEHHYNLIIIQSSESQSDYSISESVIVDRIFDLQCTLWTSVATPATLHSAIILRNSSP